MSDTVIYSWVQDCSSGVPGDASLVQHSLNMRTTYDVNVTTIRANKHGVHKRSRGALVDRGANGSIVGNDARVIRRLNKMVDVTGIDNHELNSLKMVDAAAKAYSQQGDVIIILHQCAYHGRGRSIISACQVEHYKNIVDD